MHIPARLSPALLAVALVAAAGSARPDYRHVSDFNWVDDGQALALRSENNSGVVVTRAEPSPFHGLRRGDVIVALDGRAVRHVEEVTQALATRTSPVVLRIRRGGVETPVVWSRSDYQMFSAPTPPAPPVPHN